MKYINISHNKYYQNARIFNFSSELGGSFSINNLYIPKVRAPPKAENNTTLTIFFIS